MPTMDDLATAVETDHPCSDSGCDIRAALDAGFPDVAARLLTGATDELPALDAWFDAGGTLPPDLYKCENWEAWYAYHKANGRKCEACESFNYPDAGSNVPGRCSNCGATL
jgi:hypothetical protein